MTRDGLLPTWHAREYIVNKRAEGAPDWNAPSALCVVTQVA